MTAVRSFVFLLLSAMPAAGQSIPGAVLAKHEPHHHLAYEDAVLRVLRVHVPPHDTTLLHEHDPDYFWIALGASEVVNVRLGATPATIKSADLSIHYTVGKFAHVARNPGDVSFDNITVELLGKQTNVRNLCEEAVAGAPTSCPPADRTPEPGVTKLPAFETDRLQVKLVTIMPGSAMTGVMTGAAPWIIALNAQDAGTSLRARRVGQDSRGTSWRGGVWHAPVEREWSVLNASSKPLRVLEVTAAGR